MSSRLRRAFNESRAFDTRNSKQTGTGDAVTERAYLFFVGAYILLALYLGNSIMIYGLSLILVYEGISGVRLTTIVQNARQVCLDHGLAVSITGKRFAIEGLSAWRVFVALILVLSWVLIHEYGYKVLWFIPWFMGFAIVGAGASGICPVLIGLHRVGFK